MPQVEADIQIQILDLSAEALHAFCEDIGGMFGVEMQAVVGDGCKETVSGLQKRFKKITAVNSVNAEGVLNGRFHVIFDQGGLFTLAGVVVMLPENRIKEVIRQGSKEEAQRMSDALAELGNMMVGTWDRIFRETLRRRHRHFKQACTFIGKPWDDPKAVLGVSPGDEFLFVPAVMTVGSYPEFACGVIFPPDVFAPPAEGERNREAQEVVGEVIGNSESMSESAPVPEGAVESDGDVETAAAAEPVVEPAIAEFSTGTEPGLDAAGENAEAIATASVESAADADAVDSGAQAAELVSDEAVIAADERPRLSGNAVLNMTAEQFMQKDVIWLTPGDTVQDALRKMQQHETAYLLVGSGGIPDGLVSRSDIAGALSPYLRPAFAEWKRPLDEATLQIRLSWVMSRPVRTIPPHAPLDVIIETMLRFGYRCLPVVDQAGVVKGLVTSLNVLKAITGGIGSPGRAAEPVS